MKYKSRGEYILSLSAVKTTHKPKKENATKQVLKDLADGERKSYELKQKMIKKWIQFGTIGDTLPREAGQEKVIDERVGHSGNSNLFGYSCDSIVTETLQSSGPERIYPQNDKRGSHTPYHKLKDETIMKIKEHIMCFHPQSLIMLITFKR